MSTTAWMGHSVLLTLRKQMFAHLQKLSLSFYDRNEVGRVMSRVQNDVTSLQELLTQGFFTVLADFLGLAVILYWMFKLDWVLAVASMAVLPLLLVVLWIWQDRAKKAFIRVRTAIAVVNSNLQENISGVRVIQSLNREDENLKRFDKVNEDNLTANIEAARLTAIVNPAVEISVAIATAVVIVFGGIQAINGVILPGTVVAFALYIQRFFDPVRELVMQYTSLQRAMAGGQRSFEVLDTKPEIVDKPEALPMPPIVGEVRFDHVNFSYIPGVPVLQDVSFAVSPGETVALVGHTGSGKTTVTALVERLYDVTSGSIRIDGYDIRDVQRISRRDRWASSCRTPSFSPALSGITSAMDAPKLLMKRLFNLPKLSVLTISLCNSRKVTIPSWKKRGQNISLGQRQLMSFARHCRRSPDRHPRRSYCQS